MGTTRTGRGEVLLQIRVTLERQRFTWQDYGPLGTKLCNLTSFHILRVVRVTLDLNFLWSEQNPKIAIYLYSVSLSRTTVYTESLLELRHKKMGLKLDRAA